MSNLIFRKLGATHSPTKLIHHAVNALAWLIDGLRAFLGDHPLIQVVTSMAE